MRQALKWLWLKSEQLSHWATILALFAACIGGYFAYSQLEQANDHRRWQNYNDMNIRYAELHKEMPSEIASGCIPDNFGSLSPETQRWTRQYLNLYSEEYWLFLNELIPDEMWSHRIHGGVRVNLSKYPAIVSGYYYWEARGAFNHPSSFKAEVEKAILDAKHLPKYTKTTVYSSGES